MTAPPTVVKLERRRAGSDEQRHPAAVYLGLLIIDAQRNVRHSFWDGRKGADVRSSLCRPDGSLRPEIDEILARLLDDVEREESFEARLVLLDEDRSFRLSPLASVDEPLFALVVETDRNADSIARATKRFQLTRRQSEVLTLLIQGASAAEIAQALFLSEYTAQGYIKSLLSKTGSRNRAAMVAKVLDWSHRPALGKSAAPNGSKAGLPDRPARRA
jgi:DNA-binding CsgD family transcriptional regulator